MLSTHAKHPENQDITSDGAMTDLRPPDTGNEVLIMADLVYEAIFQKIGHEMFEMSTNQGKVLQIICAAAGNSISAKEIQAFLGKSFTPNSFRILMWRLSRIVRNIGDISFERPAKERYRLRWIGEEQMGVDEHPALVQFYHKVKLTFREIAWQEHKIYLHETQYTILRHLFAHPEQVVESNVLLDLTGELHNNLPDKRTLDCHIFRIRSMLSGFPLAVTTVRGIGFIFHKNEIADTSPIIHRYETMIGRPIYKCRNRPSKTGRRQKPLVAQTYTEAEHSALLRAMERTLRVKLANTRIRFIHLKEILPPGTTIANEQVRAAATKVIESYISGSYLYPFGCNYYAKKSIKLGASYFDSVCSCSNLELDGHGTNALSITDCIEQNMRNVG